MDQEQRYKESKKASYLGLWGNIVLTLLKGSVGLLAGSTALVADAVHSASDFIGTVIVIKGVQIAHLPPDQSHPYGHHKAESIVSKIIAIILMITAAFIAYEAGKILFSGVIMVPRPVAILVAFISILVKEGLYRYTIRIGRKYKNSALIADAWHQRSDALSSIAALIGITGAVLGYPFMDPLAGIVVAGLIFKTALDIYIDAINDLMDSAPPKEVLDKITDAAKIISGVRKVSDVKVRRYGSLYYVDMKINVSPDLSVEKGHAIAARVKANVLLEIEDVKDVLIHVNPHYGSDALKE